MQINRNRPAKWSKRTLGVRFADAVQGNGGWVRHQVSLSPASPDWVRREKQADHGAHPGLCTGRIVLQDECF